MLKTNKIFKKKRSTSYNKEVDIKLAFFLIFKSRFSNWMLDVIVTYLPYSVKT